MRYLASLLFVGLALPAWALEPYQDSLDIGTLPGKRFMCLDASETEEYNLLGKSVAFGDFDGDGYADLIFSEESGDPPGRDNEGVAYVVYGGLGAFDSIPDTLDLRRIPRRHTVILGSDDPNFPRPLQELQVADYDGDGKDDIAFAGGKYLLIVYGLASPPDTIDLEDTARAEITIIKSERVFFYSNTSANPGDFDGDGHLDLFAPFGGAWWSDALEPEGAVFVVYGDGSRWPKVLDLDNNPYDYTVFYGAGKDYKLGSLCAFGDFDGDGKDDIFAHAGGLPLPSGDTGLTFLLLGKSERWPDSVALGYYSSNPAMYKITNTSNTKGWPMIVKPITLTQNSDAVFRTNRGILLIRGGSLPYNQIFSLDDIPLSHEWLTSDLGSPYIAATDIGDMDGDGRFEILPIVHLVNDLKSTAYLVFGGYYPTMDMDSEPPDNVRLSWLIGNGGRNNLISRASIGDFDGDGVGDLAFGLSYSSGLVGLQSSGEVLLVRGERPPNPSLVFPTDSAYINSLEVSFTWTCPSRGVPPGRYELHITPVGTYILKDTTMQITLPNEGDMAWSVLLITNLDTAYSEHWIFIVDTTKPTISLAEPDSGSYLSETRVGLEWYVSDRSPVLSVVQVDTSPSFSSPLFVDTTAYGVRVDTVELPGPGVYYWRVKGIDKATNEGPWSSVWSFEVDTLAPEQVSLVYPDSGAYLNTLENTHRWNPVSSKAKSPVRYLIQIDTSESFSEPLFTDSTDADSLSFTVPGEGAFYWRVMAYDLAGHMGPWSEVWVYEVDTTLPARFALLSPEDSSTLSDTTTVFSWEAVEKGSPVSYVLQVDTSSSFSSPLHEDTTEATEDTLGVPLYDTWYCWHVRGVDAAGNEGPWSPIWHFYIQSSGAKEGAPLSFFAKPLLGALSFGVPKPSKVSLKLYDSQGRLAADASGLYQPGYYSLKPALRPGVYFVRMEAEGFKFRGKLIIR